jgi:hypothetical protein
LFFLRFFVPLSLVKLSQACRVDVYND